MSLNEEDRITIVRYRIERAENAFLQAKANFKMGFVEVTANRLYYAAYYAVSALLIANKIPAHSHDGNISPFGLHFVKTGKVDKENGKLLNRLFTMRLTGDYSDRFNLRAEDIESFIEPTATFIKTVSHLALVSLQSED